VGCLVLLAGLFSAFSVPVRMPEVLPVQLQKAGAPAAGMRVKTRKLSGVRKSESERVRLRQKAEAAAAEAIALRQKQIEKELKAAILSFQKSAEFFEAARLNGNAADAILQAGEIYFTLSRYDKALGFYRRARRLDPRNPELVCRVLGHMARTFATKGESPSANNYSSQALTQCSTIPNLKLQAEAFESRGEALWYSGKGIASVEFFERARELSKKASDPGGEARAVLMLAYAHFHDQHAEALRLAEEALELWFQQEDRHGVAEAHAAFGIFAATTGEFETAQCNFQQSLPVFHSMGDKDNEGIALNMVGYVARETGDAEASLKNYSIARTLLAGVQDDLGEVEAITGMGKSLSAMRQYQRLLPLYKIKLNIAHRTGNVGHEASALADLGAVYELEHQYGKAKSFYWQALAVYKSAQHEYGVGDVLVRLAILSSKQGKAPEAIHFLEDARSLKEKTGQVGEVARINYELAIIYRRLGSLQDARSAIQKTIDIIETQRLKIADFDSRASYFSSVHKYYALYIQILMLLDRQDPGLGLAQLALEASEKSKVRALLDLLNASKEDSPCRELLQRQHAPLDAAKVYTAEKQDEFPAPPVLNLKQIQAEIGNDTALLEYVLGDEKSYVWYVDSNRVTAYELPRADKIRKLVREFRNALTARQPRPNENSLKKYKERVRQADLVYRKLAERLSQMLLGSMELAPAKRLLIVPDGPLQYVPFSALPLAPTGKNNNFLMSDHEVVFLPSVSALNALRKAGEKKPPATHTGVILADPVVERDDSRVTHVNNAGRNKSQEQPPSLSRAWRDSQGSPRIIRLPGSRQEAQGIQEILKPDVLVALDFNANRENILHGALEQFRYVHFATHGIIDVSHPEMSGLVLSLVNEQGHFQDGYLRLGDIYKLKLSADLVVLSACNSALGKDLESEGIIGLPRGFLYAGSKSVIASLWKVDDDAAADFMKGLYVRIKQGESPSSALRGVQLEMAQGHRWSEPFYWAAFTLQGDYK
jgi:CHAT domain-containing protein